MLVDDTECREKSYLSKDTLKQIPARYRGWKLTTKVSNGKLWLRWQHPSEDFSRYGCPINEHDLASTINQVKFAIDLAIKLEESAKQNQQI